MKAKIFLSSLTPIIFIVFCMVGCVDSDPAKAENEELHRVIVRSCNTVTQTYVNGIKSLAASELSISPGSVNVGAVELITPTSGLWYDPSEVVGIVTDDFEGFLFVAYEDDPLTDEEVVGYYYDEGYCSSPSSGNIITDDFEGVTASSLGIVTDDIEGF